MLPPPPPIVVDLEPLLVVAPVAAEDPEVQAPIESESTIYVFVTEMTPSMTLPVPVTVTLSSAYTHVNTRNGEEATVTELVRHFHPVSADLESV